MDSPERGSKKEFRPRAPKWTSPLWYLPIMLLVLWFWQSTVNQFAYRTIPYSEFKQHVRRHEIAKCIVREDEVQGEIQPKPEAATTAGGTTNSAAAADTKPFLFRAIRVEDPKLVDDLEA